MLGRAGAADIRHRGEAVDFRGRFFTIDGAAIRPAPRPRPPILVGGRSDAAVERYVPHGTPDDVAEALVPYLERGCRRFNIVPEGEGLEACVEAVASVKARLAGLVATPA